MRVDDSPSSMKKMPDGPGAAALFSAGLGVFTLAVLATMGDHFPAFKKSMIFYMPTGALSGVTTIAVVVWIASWAALDLLWRRRDSKGWAITAGLALMGLGFLLMIPGVGDLL